MDRATRSAKILTPSIQSAVAGTITAARQHWVTVLITSFFVLVIVTLDVYVWPPLYQAKASICSRRTRRRRAPPARSGAWPKI